MSGWKIAKRSGTNTKRTTVQYLNYPLTSIAQFGLVSSASVYDTNLTTELKRVETDYNLAAAYANRRIIGLPAEVRSYGKNDATQNLEFVSKTTYSYDEENFAQEPNQIITPTRHDTTNYGSTFITGRGNLTSATRHDVTGQTAAVTSRTRYDIAGSVVARLDPLNRKVAINYTDNFNSTGNPATFAYPTTITDPANSSSTVKYRYDFGANVRAQSPAPQGQSQGKITEREYDSLGRLSKDKIVNLGGAYTRYEYPANGIQSKVFSTIIDATGNGADITDEVLSESWSDGAGRVRMSRTEHPGSTGGWSAALTDYDILGRVARTSVPTEISVSGTTWTPAGDDAARGWIWNYAYYDWKGRTIRTVPTDSTGTDGKDTLITYEGCGCAGGQVTTVKGPITTAVDVAGTTQTTKRRTQKAYEDILGRTYKTEVWDLDGTGTAPYGTVKTTFNGRDQAILVRQYSGSDTSSTYQDTTSTFDGHGRLKTSHSPEQRDTSNNLKYTTYNYNPDDSIESVTDGRGAVTNYIYNSRGLVTNVAWTVPGGSGIVDPADVTFSYDNLGNRTQMTDGLGTQSYAYDSLSRITSETRSFTGFNSYTLDYTYTLSGQVKSYGSPSESTRTVSYGFDKTGRVTGITGGGFGGAYNYLTNIEYRAFESPKSGSYGSGKTLTQTYNDRLNISQYTVSNTANTSYGYDNDGSIKTVTDQIDNRFDRLYRSDHQGRLKVAKSGLEARDETQTSNDRPFRQTYGYNAFSNMSDRTNTNWGQPADPVSDSFVNNRRQNGTYNVTLDNEGRETQLERPNIERITNDFDAAGRRRLMEEFTWDSTYSVWTSRWYIFQEHDGDGQRLKQLEGGASFPNYFIRSSVLGGAVVGELRKANDIWLKDVYVYAGGEIIAQQRQNYQSADEIKFVYTNPITGAQRGAVQREPDPLGADQGLSQQQPNPPIYSGDSGIMDPGRYSDAFNGRFGCTVDGAPESCDVAESLLGSESGVQCPNNDCSPVWRGNRWQHFRAFADGHSGYMPVGAIYVGGGRWTPEVAKKKNRKPPTLKRPTKAETAARRARAAAGIYDEPLEGDVDASVSGGTHLYKDVVNDCLAVTFPYTKINVDQLTNSDQSRNINTNISFTSDTNNWPASSLQSLEIVTNLNLAAILIQFPSGFEPVVGDSAISAIAPRPEQDLEEFETAIERLVARTSELSNAKHLRYYVPSETIKSLDSNKVLTDAIATAFAISIYHVPIYSFPNGKRVDQLANARAAFSSCYRESVGGISRRNQ